MAKYIITEEKEITVVLKDTKLKDSEIIIEPDYWTNDNVTLKVETDKSGEIYYKKNEDGNWTKYEGELNIDENCDIYFKLVYKDGEGPETIKKITNIVKPKEEVAKVTTDRYSVIFDSVQKAIDTAGEENAEVTLLKDNIEECVTIAENQNIVLDVNGKTLVGVNESTITNNGILAIKGQSGTITCSGADTIKNVGSLVKDTETKIENTSTADYGVINNTGAITISAGTIESGWRGIRNYELGTVTVTGGTLNTVYTTISNFGRSESEGSPAIRVTGNPILISTNGNVISNGKEATGLIYINGGTINQPTANNGSPPVINSGNGKIIIEEGTIRCSGTNAVVYNGYNGGNSTGTVEIRGGTIESDTAVGVNNNEKGNIIISGGNISTKNSLGIKNNVTGTIDIKAGTIQTTGNIQAISNIADGKINVSGGTITSVNHAIRNGGTGTITVTGGTLNSTGETGIYNVSTGTIIIGTNESTPSVSKTVPSITGAKVGISNLKGTFNFYDGIIMGSAGISIVGTVTETPEGYTVRKTVTDNVETSILDNTYNVTFNYNGVKNYVVPVATNKTCTGFNGEFNQRFKLGTIYLDDLTENDKLTISFDVSYSGLTVAEGKTPCATAQGYGDVTEWLPSLGAVVKQSWLGTATTSCSGTITLSEDRIRNKYYVLELRADYYSGGTITISNIKVIRTTTETKSLKYGTQLGTLPTPSETGYKLDGWYTAPVGGTKISTTTTVPAANTTYYAQWVDNIVPVIESATASTTSDIASYVNFNATDGGSGIKYYNISTSNTAPTTWIPVVSAVETTTETKYENSAAWARVFHHNNHWGNILFSSANSGAEAKSSNTVDKYSVLANIANYKNSSNWEFMLQYPGVSGAGYNRWTQTVNPTTSSTNVGYTAVGTPTWTGNAWGGLALSSSTTSTLIDGSPGDGTWYYAIGAYSAYQGGVPGPNSTKVGTVNLWSRIDNLTATTTSNLTRRLGDLKSNTTYYVWVKDAAGNTASKAVTVSNVDTSAPTATITSTNNVAASQTATLTLSDNDGLDKYYWGTSNPANTNVTYTSIDGSPKSKTITKTVSANGTYYLSVLDKAGNRSIVNKAFYKTTLTPNRSSVSPTSVITMAGNSFTIPTPSAETGYTFNGWFKEAALTNSAGTSYTPTSSITLYGKWTINTYTIAYALNGGSVSTANPTSYNVTTNTITLNNPTKTGYTFAGWVGSNDVSSGLGSYTTSSPYNAAVRDHLIGNEFAVTSGTIYRVFVTAKRTKRKPKYVWRIMVYCTNKWLCMGWIWRII